MSVFSSKKFLIPVITTVGVGTVAIGTGVGITVNQQKTSEEINKTETVNWTELTPASINLQKVVEGIDQKDIAIFAKKNGEDNSVIRRKNLVETNSKLERTNTYAFDVTKDQLALDEAKKTSIPTGVEISFVLDTQTNNSASLNEGKLVIIIKAKQGNNSAEKKITLEGLKTIDQTLKTLISSSKGISLLDVATKQLEKVPMVYKTIKELNEKTPIAVKSAISGRRLESYSVSLFDHEEELMEKTDAISGLNQLIKDSLAAEDSAQISIDQEVKLSQIKLENDKTYFYLTSSTDNGFLKIKTIKDQTVNEAVIDQIKVANLLADEVLIIPLGINEDKTNKLSEQLKDKGYTLGEDNKLSLKISLTDDSPNVTIIPSLIDKTQKDEVVKANIKVYFGTKTFDTSKDDELKVLQESGFSFGIYTKVLEEKDELLEATKLKDDAKNKLTTYFTKDNFIKGIDIKNISMEMMKDKGPMGGYSLKTITGTQITKDFELAKASKVTPEPASGLEVEQQKLDPENWVSFISYSYKGMKQDTVLLTPFLSLTHLAPIQTPTPDTSK